MTQNVTLSIIGPGVVGCVLATMAYLSQEYDVIIGSRDTNKAKQALATIESLLKDSGLLNVNIKSMDMVSAAEQGDIVLLTVSDNNITSVCEELASRDAFKTNAVVGHCSGAITSQALVSAQQNKLTHIMSMHPLQTFPKVSSAIKSIEGSYCYYEGDSTALSKTKALIDAVKMKPVEIKQEAKALYHASAVVACNYLSSLMDASLELGETAGIDRQTLWASLLPLVTSTLGNINTQGPSKALTGPIKRGDSSTIKGHLSAIKHISNTEQADRLNKLYSAMGIQTLALAKTEDTLTQEAYKELLDIFMLNYEKK